MINKSVITFPSKDGIHHIFATKWQSDEVSPIAILQIVHGMAEYIDRYEEMACYFAKQGFIVVGDDHLGHGRTAEEYGDYGYFCKKHASTVVVRDVHQLKKLVQKDYPNLPYFILGHSMGSFILRNYISYYGSGIQGAIICGTAHYGNALPVAARVMTRMMRLCKKDREKSAFLDSVAFQGYNKRTDNRTKFDWLNTDEKEVDLYMRDPLCGFLFTVNGFDTLFGLLQNLSKKSFIHAISKDLPIYLIAGSEDPVGNYGKGVATVYEQYKHAGIKDLQIKLYEGARHEIMLEPIKQQVFIDVCNWLKDHL